MGPNTIRLAGVVVMLLGFAQAQGSLAEEIPANAVALNRAMASLVDRWRTALDQPDGVPNLSMFLETQPLKLDLVQGSFRTLRELET